MAKHEMELISSDIENPILDSQLQINQGHATLKGIDYYSY